MKRYVYILIFITLMSCHTHKKVAKNKESLYHEQQQQETVVITDSLQSAREIRRFSKGEIQRGRYVEIVPIGPFRFSVNDGFTGEAARISVVEQEQHDYASSIDSTASREETSNRSRKQSAENTLSTKTTKTDKLVKGPVTWWVLALLIGLLLLIRQKR